MKRSLRTLLIVIFIVVGITLSAQTENEKGDNLEYLTTESGLKYIITQKSDGEIPAKGERVKVHYTGTLEDGTKFDSSLDRGEPFTFELGAGQVIKGWDEGIALLHKGEKATLIIPSELGYGSRDMGTIPPNSTLIFEVELVDILEEVKIEPFDIKEKGSSKTESGLEFILVEAGNGKKAGPGYTVTVNYTGYLEDGSIFDSSLKRDQPFVFQLGMGRVIKGWDEGIAMMKVGDKARLIIPYQLAYGEKGYPGVIPPKATLIFDVELLDVK